MEKELEEVGLTGKESKVYLYLLKRENLTATDIAKNIKINRSFVYAVIERLINKGLVTYKLVDGVRRFSASDPRVLKDFLDDKQRLLKKILPTLSTIQKQRESDFSVEVYEGVKGGIAILKDIVRTGKDYVVFGDEGRFQELGTIVEQYVRQLNERKIGEKIITRKGVKLVGNAEKSEVRYLPKEFRFPAGTAIYGDKVAIAVFEEGWYAILIKSKSLALTYRKLFEGLWKIAG